MDKGESPLDMAGTRISPLSSIIQPPTMGKVEPPQVEAGARISPSPSIV